MSDGYYSSKKTDDICDDVCGQVSSGLCLVSVTFFNRFVMILVLVFVSH